MATNALASAFHFGPAPAPPPAPPPPAPSPLTAAAQKMAEAFAPPAPPPAPPPAIEDAAKGGMWTPWPLTLDPAKWAANQAELVKARAEGRVREYTAPVGPGGAAQRELRIMLPFAGRSTATGKPLPDPAHFPFPPGYPHAGDWTIPLDDALPSPDNGKRYGGASDAQWSWLSDRKRAIWGTGHDPGDDYAGPVAEALMSAKEQALFSADRWHSEKGLRAATDIVGGVIIASVAATAAVGIATSVAAMGGPAAAAGGGGAAPVAEGGAATAAASTAAGGAAPAGISGLGGAGLVGAAGTAAKVLPLAGQVLGKLGGAGAGPAGGVAVPGQLGAVPGAQLGAELDWLTRFGLWLRRTFDL